MDRCFTSFFAINNHLCLPVSPLLRELTKVFSYLLLLLNRLTGHHAQLPVKLQQVAGQNILICLLASDTVDRQVMKQLLLRWDARPLRDMLLYYLVMAFCAGAATRLCPRGVDTLWLIYGVLYTSVRMPDGMNAAMAQPLNQHSNKFFYSLACFMTVRNPVTWNISCRYHTDTLLLGRDAEIGR